MRGQKRRRGGGIFRRALSQALAHQDLALTLEQSSRGRVVTLVRQSSGERLDSEEEEEAEEIEEGEEEEEEEEEEDDEVLSHRVNTKFLSSMLTSLARTNARKLSEAATTEAVPTTRTAPLLPPPRNLSERRARAEAHIRRIAASCGLRVDVSIDETHTEAGHSVGAAARPPVAQQGSGSGISGSATTAAANQPAALAASRLLGAALLGSVAKPKRSAAEVSALSGRAGASVPTADESGSESPPQPKQRRTVQPYVPPSRRKAEVHAKSPST